MWVRSVWCAAALTALACVSLTACDQKLASQPARDHRSVDALPTSATASAGETAEASVGAGAQRVETSAPLPSAAPTRLIDGKPMWADNRRHTAEENAQYQFEHHGQELGAASLDDFLTKAHRFVADPPAGALTLTRANGDHLTYDPKSGLFSVARSDGAPRLVSKPADGQAVWDKQVEETKSGGDGYRSTRRTASKGGDGQG